MTDAPGNLGWRPAAGHAELLADSTAQAVRELGVDCLVAPIDADLADTAAFCERYAVGLDESANCVVVKG